jgi:HAD superfamily hydrolase (TIGR01509 family)
MSAVRVVLFDLGNVLITFDPMRFWDALGIVDEARRADIKPRMLALGREYESGSITTPEFRQRFHELFDGAHTHDELDAAFRTVLPDPIPGMEEIVRRAAATCEIGLVSNTNPIHFDMCLETVPALKHVDRFYVSYEVGALKPDPAYYAGVRQGEQASPGEMVFIDDLGENVTAANNEGFKGIRFTGTDDLEKALVGLQVLHP